MKPIAYIRGLWRCQSLGGDPVVIGGCERSGTTLVLSVLSAHPRVLAIPYETWALAWGPKAGLADSHEIRMRRIWRGIGVAQRRGGEDRWAEKSPANVFYFRKILGHFGGRVRCVEVVRDGRDVVTSIHPEEDGPWVPVERWVEAVKAGREVEDHPSVCTVRYEDLVMRPSPTMANLYGFLGLSVPGRARSWRERASVTTSPNLLGERVGRLRTSSVRKWERDNFGYLDRVRRLMRDRRARRLLKGLGYNL